MNRLIENLNIDYFITIDDAYSANFKYSDNKDAIEPLLWNRRNDHKDLYEELEIDFDERDMFKETVIERMEELESEHEILFEGIDKTHKEQSFINAIDEVISNLPSSVVIEKLDNFENPEVLIEKIKNKKAIVFIDKSINDKNGITLFNELHKEGLYNANFLFIVTNDDKETTLNELYEKMDGKIPKQRLSVIQKHEINQNYEKNSILILRELEKQYVNVITSYIHRSVNDASTVVTKDILELNQGFLKEVIVNYSIKEGVLPTETFLRIYISELISKIHKNISESQLFINQMLNVFTSSFKDLPKIYDYKFDKVYGFLNHERFSNFYINLKSPPLLGDMYLINSDFYILISQPCDSIVRDNSGKICRKLKNALLLKLDAYNVKEQNDNDLKYFKYDNQYMSLRPTKHTIAIDYFLLDLCNTNSSSSALMNLKENPIEDSSILTMYERYVMEKYNDFVQKNYETSSEIETILNLSRYVPYKIDHKDSVCSFKIKRLPRVNQIDSIYIMNSYFSGSARIGREGDYGRQSIKLNIFVSTDRNDIVRNNDLGEKKKLVESIEHEFDVKDKQSLQRSIEVFIKNKYGIKYKNMFNIVSSSYATYEVNLPYYYNYNYNDNLEITQNGKLKMKKHPDLYKKLIDLRDAALITGIEFKKVANNNQNNTVEFKLVDLVNNEVVINDRFSIVVESKEDLSLDLKENT